MCIGKSEKVLYLRVLYEHKLHRKGDIPKITTKIGAIEEGEKGGFIVYKERKLTKGFRGKKSRKRK